MDCLTVLISILVTSTLHEAVSARRPLRASTLNKLPDNCNASCPACPAKDTSLFDSTTGDLIEPDLYGEWVTSTSCDDKLYLFSECGLNWFDAYDKCCKLGMNLISLPTDEEYDCFTEANTDTNGRWWTSGTDEGCTLKSKLIFSWCSNPQMRFAYGDTSSSEDLPIWHKKEPNNAQNAEKCVRLDRDGDDTYLTDKSCNNMYKYACEGPTTPAPSSGGPCTVHCPTNCALNPLIDPTTAGIPVPRPLCGRTYFFPQPRVGKSWSEAYAYCCSVGYELLAFEDVAAKNCFFNAFDEGLVADPNTIYWVGATNNNCAAADSLSYKWCSSIVSSTSVISDLWRPAQPDYQNPNDKCAAFTVEYNGLGQKELLLSDMDCTAGHFFVCEKVI